MRLSSPVLTSMNLELPNWLSHLRGADERSAKDRPIGFRVR